MQESDIPPIPLSLDIEFIPDRQKELQATEHDVPPIPLSLEISFIPDWRKDGVPPEPDIEPVPALSSEATFRPDARLEGTGPDQGPSLTPQPFRDVSVLDEKDPFPQNTDVCLDGRINRKSTYPVSSGGYADVYEGLFDGRQVAVKVMRSFGGGKVAIKDARPFGSQPEHEGLILRFWREYLIWSRLSHPNILTCLGYSYDFSPESYMLPSLVSPWMANGTVPTYLKDNPDVDRLKLLVGVAEGLSYLHTRSPVVIHGDLRAGNILVSDQGTPCLADFGSSRVLGSWGVATMDEPVGPLRWLSPEVLKKKPNYSDKSDIWAYGMTVLEVLSGERPYSTIKSDLRVLNKISNGQTPSRPQDAKMLDDDMWGMCQLCWSSEPTSRPSMEAVINMITFSTPSEPKVLPAAAKDLIPSAEDVVYVSGW